MYQEQLEFVQGGSNFFTFQGDLNSVGRSIPIKCDIFTLLPGGAKPLSAPTPLFSGVRYYIQILRCLAQ